MAREQNKDQSRKQRKNENRQAKIDEYLNCLQKLHELQGVLLADIKKLL